MNFVDTNILLYAFGTDEDSDRPAVARRLIAAGDIAFSIQVFQEFFVQATHSRRDEPLTSEEAEEVIESLSAFPVQENNLSVFREALRIQREFQTSFWDANILSAARALGSEIVWSEDLAHDQDYGGVRVVNPFLE